MTFSVKQPLTPHPLAGHAPTLSDAMFEELSKNIKDYGQKIPILLFENKVLDGRHRERACIEQGLDPIYEQFEGTFEEARAAVWSLNGTRRQLTASQKASLAAGLATAEPGRPSKKTPPVDGVSKKDEAKTVKEVAKETGVPKRSIERAKRVQKETPALAKQVASGEKSLVKAETQAKEVKAGKKTEKQAVKEKPARAPAKGDRKTLEQLSRVKGINTACVEMCAELDPAWVVKNTQVPSVLKYLDESILMLSKFRDSVEKEAKKQ